jgi:ribosome biogenesis GTPase
MTPKFRGDSDDWMDDEGPKGPEKTPHKKHNPKVAFIGWEDTNADVVEVYPKQCRVRFSEEEVVKEALCSYRRAQVLGIPLELGELRERAPVCVGDRVKAHMTDGVHGVIEGLARRKNQLFRPAPDRYEKSIHIMAANFDRLCIVASALEPEFSMGIVDRFLVAASVSRLKPLIVLNKIDLEQNVTIPQWRVYATLGYELFEVSAKYGTEIPTLRAMLKGQRVVFSGHSGVGKTSLLRALFGEEVGKIGHISDASGKGRHTTSSSILYRVPGIGEFIDTPGVREFGVLQVAPEDLWHHFPELKHPGCAVTSCLHIDEKGCKARELPRYASYKRLYQSLAGGEF